MIKGKISEFSERVIKNILKIPKGKVATYKQIAGLAGKPHGARGVAWILNSSSKAYKLPWHRVLNSQGKIAFDIRASNFNRQKRLLESEGIVIDLDGTLDLKKYQWKKVPPKPKIKPGEPKMFQY